MQRYYYQTITAVMLLFVVAGSGSPETDLAAPGAPLYEKAVKESVTTLMSKKEQAKLGADSRPPSPGPDYYWCENCKTYHKRQTQPSAQKPVSTPKQGTAPAPQSGVAATRPPSPGPEYYWCAHCKTYHKRKAPASGQGQTPSPAAAGVAPSPGANYYYCEKCKTYHLRKAMDQHSVEKLIVGGTTNSPNRNPHIGP